MDQTCADDVFEVTCREGHRAWPTSDELDLDAHCGAVASYSLLCKSCSLEPVERNQVCGARARGSRWRRPVCGAIALELDMGIAMAGAAAIAGSSNSRQQQQQAAATAGSSNSRQQQQQEQWHKRGEHQGSAVLSSFPSALKYMH